MPSADREKWDAIYRARRGEAGAPAELLVRFDNELPRVGRALDVAGGAGRNAIWLAARGLDVTLADVSPEGLALATQRASQSGVSISTLEIDLETSELPGGRWQLIIDFHFLHRPLFGQLPSRLASGGLFVFCQPTVKNLERHAKPSRRFLLDVGELLGLLPAELDVLHHREGWSPEGRHEAELVCRLPHVA